MIAPRSWRGALPMSVSREYVFSDQYIMVYRIDADVVEILSIVPTAVNWANSAKKIKPLI